MVNFRNAGNEKAKKWRRRFDRIGNSRWGSGLGWDWADHEWGKVVICGVG